MVKACDKESIFGLIANYLLQCKEKQIQQSQEQLQAIEKITSDTLIQLIPQKSQQNTAIIIAGTNLLCVLDDKQKIFEFILRLKGQTVA